MSSVDCSAAIQLNPDIAGIGIRVSLYILALAGPILALCVQSKELFQSIERSLGITGLAVLLTTFISHGQGTLDLFHALIVLHLIGLTGFSITPDLKQMPSRLVRQLVSFGLFYMGLLGFCIFVIYIFVTAPTFGSTSHCNDEVLYVLFGFAVPATNYEFRWLFIAAMILVLVVVLLAMILTVLARLNSPAKDVEEVSYLTFIGDMAGRAYIIAMLELIITKNGVQSNPADWSFGQILAMMMLIGPVIEFISIFTHKEEESEGKEEKLKGADETARATQLFYHLVLSLLDLAFNAAAGAAAAATGAHVNGDAVTPEIVNLGALCGVVKSGILNYSILVAAASSTPVSAITMFVTSTFGMAFIIAVAVSERTIGLPTDSILIAALAAGAPLTAGGAVADASTLDPSFFPGSAGFDALAGYTFARVAHNYGSDVCSWNAAAAAGGVFGVVLWAMKLPLACLRKSRERNSPNAKKSSYGRTIGYRATTRR